MFSGLIMISKKIKREIRMYRAILKDNRTPLISKILLLIAIGYLLLPFDFIPDWIPVSGLLDDTILIPSFVILAMLFVPKQVVLDHRDLVQVPI